MKNFLDIPIIEKITLVRGAPAKQSTGASEQP